MAGHDETKELVPTDNLPAIRTAGRSTDLWDAVKEAAPDLVELDAVVLPHELAPGTDAHAGFRHWLTVQFALGFPLRVIRDDLRVMHAEQVEAGDAAWPEMTARQLTSVKKQYEDDWRPIARRIEDGIEQVGVLAKNRRLLALQRMFERVEEQMWQERSAKTNQLYLIPQALNVLRAIAEEKGELGDTGESAVDVLGQIAKKLVENLQLQGSGIQGDDHAPQRTEYFAVEVDPPAPD